MNELIETPVPNELASFVLNRLNPIIEKFYNSEQHKARSPYVKESFGIRELVISCYKQGLNDAVAVKDKL